MVLNQQTCSVSVASAIPVLQECGIGRQASEESPLGGVGSPPEGPLDSGGAGHRVLVFAQLKSLLELVEKDVLQPGGVSFLRLDGRYAKPPSTPRTAFPCPLPTAV